MPLGTAYPIRVLLAAVSDQQRSLVEASLERANVGGRHVGTCVVFELEAVDGRGMEVLKKASAADVVLFGLDEEELPGEASHVLAAYPAVRIVGVDGEGHARIVLGAVLEPLSRDLPTVIRWITRRCDDAGELPPRSH